MLRLTTYITRTIISLTQKEIPWAVIGLGKHVLYQNFAFKELERNRDNKITFVRAHKCYAQGVECENKRKVTTSLIN